MCLSWIQTHLCHLLIISMEAHLRASPAVYPLLWPSLTLLPFYILHFFTCLCGSSSSIFSSVSAWVFLLFFDPDSAAFLCFLSISLISCLVGCTCVSGLLCLHAASVCTQQPGWKAGLLSQCWWDFSASYFMLQFTLVFHSKLDPLNFFPILMFSGEQTTLRLHVSDFTGGYVGSFKVTFTVYKQ